MLANDFQTNEAAKNAECSLNKKLLDLKELRADLLLLKLLYSWVDAAVEWNSFSCRMYLTRFLIAYFLIRCSFAQNRLFYSKNDVQLKTLVELLIDEVADNSRCIISMVDTYYRRKVDLTQLKAHNLLPIYTVLIRENEEFSPPRRRLLRILNESKYVGCDIYLILLANGLQVADFLRYIEEERLINAQGRFVIMYDFRIFHSEMRYLWNRLINVVFLRHYVEYKRRSNRRLQKRDWYDLNTIPFPARSKGLVVTRYIDTWYQNRFRYGIHHFFPKTNDLRKQKLRVAVFEHVPAVTEDAKSFFKNLQDVATTNTPLGIEFEMLLIIASKLNFRPDFYQPENIQNERWGNLKNDAFTGLFGEAKDGNAVFYLGDIHYTKRHLQILDLSWPYNTECLTFLTLESLTENSWKLLILPFRLYTWVAVILMLLLATAVFLSFAYAYENHINLKDKRIPSTNMTKKFMNNKWFLLIKKKSIIEEWKGLYLFADVQNSFLYTYSMLFQVSLPMLPNAWSIRMFIGWWWLYTVLITVTYKASMTASLANSVNRVVIDTIPQLVQNDVTVGSWSDEIKDFFMNSSDSYLQALSQRYMITSNEQDAVAGVANGSFSYYENIYVLQRERVKRQMLEAELQKNGSQDMTRKFLDHNLHVMDECVINVPISLGMDKHSPLKHHVDRLVKRIVEAGLVQKWLNDIIQQSKTLELRQEGSAQKALIDLDKLQGAIVALAIGYFLGIIALGGEFWHWNKIVLKDPNYNKYRLDLFYKKE